MRIIKIIFLVCALVGLGFLFFGGKSSVLEFGNSTNFGSKITKVVVPEGFVEYRGEKYKFALAHPTNMKVTAFDEGGGASTITFENEKEVKGFQIFIVPYNEPQVSIERFKLDVPYSALKEPKDIKIDNSPATIFYTDHPLLGEMVEIWFIKNGFLYEVSTLKTLEGDLKEIMKTWLFL